MREEPVATVAPDEGLVVPPAEQPAGLTVSTAPLRALRYRTGSLVVAAAAGAVIGAVATSYLHRKTR
jgi:hypothetical protein